MVLHEYHAARAWFEASLKLEDFDAAARHGEQMERMGRLAAESAPGKAGQDILIEVGYCMARLDQARRRRDADVQG